MCKTLGKTLLEFDKKCVYYLFMKTSYFILLFNSFATMERDSKTIFKLSLISLNSEFSFSETSRLPYQG